MSDSVLYLVRHGATDVNLRQPALLQGHGTDLELADLGRQQAQAAAQVLAKCPVQYVYSSPLRRALQTARAIAEPHGLAVAAVGELVEVDVGAWEGLSWVEVAQRWPDQHRAFLDDPATSGYLDGENMTQVAQRVLPKLEALLQAHLGQTIVVVTHNVVNRVALAHWMGIPLKYARRIPQDNAGLNRIVADKNGPRVRTINAASHLAGLLPS